MPPPSSPLPAVSKFPLKLMAILDNDEFSAIITWLPHGRGFTICDKLRFEKEILPEHFKQTKYTSFTRRLNRWSFTIQQHGHKKASYFHPMFVRGDHERCSQMRPIPQRKIPRSEDKMVGINHTNAPSTGLPPTAPASIKSTSGNGHLLLPQGDTSSPGKGLDNMVPPPLPGLSTAMEKMKSESTSEDSPGTVVSPPPGLNNDSGAVDPTMLPDTGKIPSPPGLEETVKNPREISEGGVADALTVSRLEQGGMAESQQLLFSCQQQGMVPPPLSYQELQNGVFAFNQDVLSNYQAHGMNPFPVWSFEGRQHPGSLIRQAQDQQSWERAMRLFQGQQGYDRTMNYSAILERGGYDNLNSVIQRQQQEMQQGTLYQQGAAAMSHPLMRRVGGGGGSFALQGSPGDTVNFSSVAGATLPYPNLNDFMANRGHQRL